MTNNEIEQFLNETEVPWSTNTDRVAWALNLKHWSYTEALTRLVDIRRRTPASKVGPHMFAPPAEFDDNAGWVEAWAAWSAHITAVGIDRAIADARTRETRIDRAVTQLDNYTIRRSTTDELRHAFRGAYLTEPVRTRKEDFALIESGQPIHVPDTHDDGCCAGTGWYNPPHNERVVRCPGVASIAPDDRLTSRHNDERWDR